MKKRKKKKFLCQVGKILNYKQNKTKKALKARLVKRRAKENEITGYNQMRTCYKEEKE